MSGAQSGFKPMHEAHAIEQVTFTVRFDRPLTELAVRSSAEVMDSFADLPGKAITQSMMGFQFGPQGVMPVPLPMSAMPNIIVRTRTDNGGALFKELRLDMQSLVYRNLAYTRWDAAWSEALSYFKPLLVALGEDVNIAAYALGYQDKFIWTGDPKDCRPTHLLNLQSPYVTPKSIDTTDLWHCHSGRFIAVDENTKQLEAVNLDCLDEPDLSGTSRQPSRIIRITTTLTDFFNQPDYLPLMLSAGEAPDYLARVYPIVHNSLKNIFGAIVNEETANQVGLYANVI